jgi:predicted RNase H-like HicB family nuclease
MTMMTEIHSSPEGAVQDGATWDIFGNDRPYECEIAVIREEEGFSAHAAKLPGVVGQGDTLEAAIEDITQALQVVLAEYRNAGDIPWTAQTIVGEVVTTKWILVHV